MERNNTKRDGKPLLNAVLGQVGPFKGSLVKNVGLFKLFMGPDSIFSRSQRESGPTLVFFHSLTNIW